MAVITAWVNVSQPWRWCDAEWPARTVKVALSSNTPSAAHRDKSPFTGGAMHKSLANSLKILTNEGGKTVPSLTEKHNPLAWFGLM